jgi:DNA-directed RNA polymerase subunit RPC12/RpoP
MEYYICSECREEFSYDGETGIKMNGYDFCPNCGVRMIEPQESEIEE